MAGREKSRFRRALYERIKAKGGLSVIYERIATGEPLTRIAKDYDVSRAYLRVVLVHGETRMKLFLDAQRDAASAHAEDGMQILDDASTLSREEIAKAKERANYRRWLASKLDKETFGDMPLAQINMPMTFGAVHLTALQSPPPPRPALPAETSGPALLPAKTAEIISQEKP